MPAGVRQTDGFPTKIAFALAPNAELWENSVAPWGLSAGGPNDTTSMRNTAYRTRQPKKLKTAENVTGVCQFDPIIWNNLIANLIGKNQLITVTLPNGGTITNYGWMDEWKPNENKEGETPTANYTIIPSNQDNTGAEYAGVYTAPPP